MEKSGDRVLSQINYARLISNSNIHSMPISAVYDHPEDYPDKFVARVYDMDKPTNLIVLGDTLDEVREAIPQSMAKIDRQQGDDPCIVETWI